MEKNVIERYSHAERSNHWVVAICFVLLLISGLAFFHPSLFWLSGFFGGGTNARAFHPFIGVVMAVAFAALAGRLWSHNVLNAADRIWLRNARKVLAGDESFSQDIGRYNGGQKRLFQLMVACVALLFVSGVVIWQPYFAGLFPITLVRIAALTHAVAAFALIIGFIVHIYATFWVKHTLRAMLRGTVTHAWAKKHHPGWYREMMGRVK